MKKIDESHPQYENAKSIGLAIAKRLDEKLGRPATLQDYIEDFISQTNYNEIEKKFWGLVTIWGTIGRSVSDAQEVYDRLFVKDKEAIEYITYGDMNFPPMSNKTFEDQLDELHILSNYNDEVPVEKINSNEEVDKFNSDKPLEKKKESGDYLGYIWGAVALFFVILPFIIKYPYVIGIVIAVGLVYLIKRQ